MKDKNFLERTFVVCLLAMLCCFLWGSAFPCIKIGYQMFQISSDQTMSQILFAGVRFTLAGILVILFGSILSRKILLPKRSSCKNILIICLFQTVIQYLFFYIGMAHTSGVKASIVEASNVFLAILVANLIFHQEKLTFSKMLGCVIGFAGVILINLTGSGLEGGMTMTGEGFILLSAAAYAVSSVLIKRFSVYENPVVISGYQFMIGGLIMIVVGLAGGGSLHPTSPASALMMLYMALISAVAYNHLGHSSQIQSCIQGGCVWLYEPCIRRCPFRTFAEGIQSDSPVPVRRLFGFGLPWNLYCKQKQLIVSF